MKHLYKYLILYIISLLSIIGFVYSIEKFSTNNVNSQKQILVKQAQTHYYDQINTRKWNASYGGMYAFPKDGQKPNPYLKNNTLKTKEGRTLIKINPAWMTRQLSEISDIKDFHFRITSLNPINPHNKATPFEKKALEYIEKTKTNEYYEFGKNNKFNYMGVLITTQACLPCHKEQGYKVGDIRGGISVTLDATEFNQLSTALLNRALYMKIIITLFIVTITLLIQKQLKNNENLGYEVQKRTKEIKSTQILLQQVLDADLSLLIVTDGDKLIFTNKTLLDFFQLTSIDEFKEKYPNISDVFEKIDNKNFLQHYVDGEHWIEYLQREQPFRELKVVIRKDNKDRYFSPHAKEIIVDDKALYLIIFNEITKQYYEMKKLKQEAAKDKLTNLFNRGKFDEVLDQLILLNHTTFSSLSIIFLDIDDFKLVNDTLGHNVGDEVLIDIAKIISSCVRKGDCVARWGGEEFVVTLQSTNKIQASILAEKIRLKVEDHIFKNAGKQTISLGVTQYKGNESKNSFTSRVDKALYEAKQTGKNKVVVY